MIKALIDYKEEVEKELENILGYWIKYTVDTDNGGFYGRIDNQNNIDRTSPKGSVLNSRILYAFSAAYNLTNKPIYLQTAERAFKYLDNYIIDKKFGGVYWSVDYRGNPLETRKQIYALSFTVYGLSEYSIAAEDQKAKQLAIGVYRDIIKYSHDESRGGYIEALTREWNEIEDLRLSAKDSNEKKSMNTHLHVLEGFANLYRIWPDETLKKHITELIQLFLKHIIDKKTNHLVLFFDEEWHTKSDIISYGHDIEAAWLVQEASEIVGDETLLQEVRERSVQVAVAAQKGLDNDGGLWYEKDKGHLIKEKHWWPQAEAMVGFFNAYQSTNDVTFLEKSLNSWRFIQEHIINKKDGEWYWGVREDYAVMPKQDKVGVWKCPYHNARACIEIIRRISLADF